MTKLNKDPVAFPNTYKTTRRLHYITKLLLDNRTKNPQNMQTPKQD